MNICIRVLFILVFAVQSVWAMEAKEVPNPRHAGVWVSDMADLLDEEQEAHINMMFQRLHEDVGVEYALITLKDVPARLSPKEFATTLFNDWGVGNAKANTGLLIVMVSDRRRIEMETGYGIDGVLTDGWLGQMQAEKMVPHFKKGAFGQGLVEGAQALDKQTRKHAEEVKKGAGGQGELPVTATPDPEQSNDETELYLITAMALLLGSGYCWIMAAVLFLPVFICLLKQYAYWRRTVCSSCKTKMTLLSEEEDDAHLTPGQQSEEMVRSVNYHVYNCSKCDTVEVISVSRWFSGYTRCVQCQNRTNVTNTTTITAATTLSTGLAQVDSECFHCGHQNQLTRVIPRVTSSSSSFGGSSSGGGSSGGGSFGGGSSGGGGAGSSW